MTWMVGFDWTVIFITWPEWKVLIGRWPSHDVNGRFWLASDVDAVYVCLFQLGGVAGAGSDAISLPVPLRSFHSLGPPTNSSLLHHVWYETFYLTHSHSRVPLEILSATWEWSKISQNIWRRFVVCLLINISHSNVFNKKCFWKGNISKIIRPLLVALSVNGLRRFWGGSNCRIVASPCDKGLKTCDKTKH